MAATSELVGLPEGCISHVLSLTSPKDACRSSITARIFKSAADSDEVWEEFLPKGYRSLLLPRMVQEDDDPSSFNFHTKRELYFRLCKPTPFDGGRLSFVLEKSTGKTCFMLSARHLHIVWVDTPRYWEWISYPNSRFLAVPELIDVCWLEIVGKISSNLLSPKTTYVAYLVFRLTSMHYGFDRLSQKASITVGENQLPTETVSVLYDNQDADEDQGARQIRQNRAFFRYGTGGGRLGRRQGRQLADQNARYTPHPRTDGWMETVLGEFFNDDGDEGSISISFREIDGGHWKRGLIVEGIEVRPKNQ